MNHLLFRSFLCYYPLFLSRPADFISSRTEPKSFLLDVYFNAQPINEEGKPKRKGTNVLVPTTIAYPGGIMDFQVDMGSKVRIELYSFCCAIIDKCLVLYKIDDPQRKISSYVCRGIW